MLGAGGEPCAVDGLAEPDGGMADLAGLASDPPAVNNVFDGPQVDALHARILAAGSDIFPA